MDPSRLGGPFAALMMAFRGRTRASPGDWHAAADRWRRLDYFAKSKLAILRYPVEFILAPQFEVETRAHQNGRVVCVDTEVVPGSSRQRYSSFGIPADRLPGSEK